MHKLKELKPYIIIVIVVVLIRSFIVTPVKVNGSSMYPTLKGGEIMLLNKLDKIERNDIVVVNFEGYDNLIKRVIALPGETIEIKRNDIYINDKIVSDKFSYGITTNMEKITLKSDEYFIMGDNRIVSLDSRYFGAINKKDIKGTTKLVLYPFKSLGVVK